MGGRRGSWGGNHSRRSQPGAITRTGGGLSLDLERRRLTKGGNRPPPGFPVFLDLARGGPSRRLAAKGEPPLAGCSSLCYPKSTASEAIVPAPIQSARRVIVPTGFDSENPPPIPASSRDW